MKRARKNPHGSKPKGWFKRCVSGVKKRGGAVDPNAVCGAIEARGNRKRSKKNPLPLALAQAGEAQFFAPATSKAQKALKKLGFKPIKFNPGKRNPADSAADVYRGFHGREAELFVEVTTDVHEHLYLAALGELISMEIITASGAVVTIKGFETKLGEPAFLASNEKRTQLFIEGGDQTVDLTVFGIREPVHESEVLGELNYIEYYTIKDHLGKEGGEAVYRHKLKKFRFRRLPEVIYDTRNHLLSISGGNYTIEDEGITN